MNHSTNDNLFEAVFNQGSNGMALRAVDPRNSRWLALPGGPGEVDNALLNLVINASDAMPGGGVLTIETANVVFDEKYAAMHSEVETGQYVMLAVTDTGTGMSPEVLEKVSEPFFTTKEPGRGTGLGLSMVYGFVRQSNGHVVIHSEPGEGITVKLYLPYSEGLVVNQPDNATSIIPQSRGETVLVVEDGPRVRELVVLILNGLGYRVIEADSGDVALARLRKEPHIDLLLSDVVIPGELRGVALAREAAVYHAGIKTMFMSGYARNADFGADKFDPDVVLLQKPFTKAQLALVVREVLDNVSH